MVDQISADDWWARTLLSWNPDEINNAFSAYYERINVDNHLRFYPSDEPVPMQYYLHKWFDTYSKSVPPEHQSTAIICYNSSYPRVYISDIQPMELFLDYYPLRASVDSLSEGANSLQNALNSMVNATRRYSQIAKVNNTDFWVMIQTHAERTCAGEWISRDPQANEIKAQVWLSLAYGAMGIGYFLYPTYYCTGEKEWPDYVDWPVDSSKIDESEWWLHGLVEKNDTTGWYEPNYKWYAVRDVNAQIDTLTPTLLALDWQGAGVCYDAASIPGSFLDSLKSSQFDSAWIEVGFFKDDIDTDYFILVNRRCLSTEEQNVTVYMDNAEIGDKKMWYVIDQYSQDTTFTGAINGSIPFTTHLGPGEGKLFKLVPFPDSAFHGGAHPLNWQGGIMVDGDVTVDSSKTLIILPPAEISFYANTDVIQTGDPEDCDFIVKGGLRAIGTETDSIIFTSTESNPNDWEGIKAYYPTDGVICSYCVVQYAYRGIDIFESYPATITHTRFHNNENGILDQYNIPTISNNTIHMDAPLDGSSGTGIELWDIVYPDSGILEANSVCNYWCGIMAVDCDNIKLYNTTISYTRIGLHSWLCSPIELDEIQMYNESPCFGIQFVWDQASTIKISNSTFQSNSNSPNLEGIFFNLSYPNSSLRRTVIENFTDNGVRCIQCEPDLGTDSSVGYNKILSDSGYFVYKKWDAMPIGSPPDTNTIYAQYNWWGEYPPDSNRFFGNVEFMPALEHEPYRIDDDLNLKPTASGQETRKFELAQNYPNPFNPVTVVQFTVGSNQSPTHTTLKIYNILGQVVKTLVNEEKTEGSYKVYWDGRNDSGEDVSSGVYFYRLEAGDYTDVKKLVLIR